MKRLIKAVIIALAVVGLTVAGYLAFDSMDKQAATAHLQADGLPTIKDGWQGNPIDQKGRFMNYEYPYMPRVIDILKWKVVDGNKFKEEKISDQHRVEVQDPSAFLASNDDGIMWMGHASFFLRLNGVSIVTDPVFGDPTFLKRFVAVPSPLEKIKAVDVILISHDHRDHLDEDSIKGLTAKFPNATIVAGLRSEEILREWAPSNPISTLGWFQQIADLNGLRITFVPVRHWSRRGLLDTNWRLWGGFVIEGTPSKIYFGGDSGYGRHYREVGEMFPNIDYFLVGIGAYEPRWFMEPNHNSPAEAVKGFKESGAKTLIPMHYGTFDLSDEPPGRPLEALMDAAREKGVADRVKPLAIYGSVTFSR
jgi:L-ascorbate metabolism protein UlaG (beta-lactamase superfamily)